MEKTIGFKIRSLREGLNMSMDDLGEKVGVTRSQVSLYELDKSSPNAIMLEKLGQALKVPAYYFLIDSESDISASPSNLFLEQKIKDKEKELDEVKSELNKVRDEAYETLKKYVGMQKPEK